jgi:hypothetical protein
MEPLLRISVVIDSISMWCMQYEQKMLSPVLDKKAIARYYVFGRSGFGGWFWLDLIAAIPFDWMPDMFEGSAFLSFAKLGRLFRLSRLISRLDEITAAHLVRVGNFLVLLLLCTHSMACIWWSVGWQTANDRGWQFSTKVASVLLETELMDSTDDLLVIPSDYGDVKFNSTRLRDLIEDVVSAAHTQLNADALLCSPDASS